MPHLLILDDDDLVREMLVELGRECGYTVAQAACVKDALIQLDMRPPDLVLADLCVPGGDGMEVCRNAAAVGSEVVIITGHGNMDNAVQALRLGVRDYLVKPVCMDRLRTLMSRVAGTRGKPPRPRASGEQGHFGCMFGESEAMQDVYRQISRVAPSAMTVFVVGESGTGKELVAQAIHQSSPRGGKPFVAVNCGAIAPSLIENEMFGHERGSYTGADRQHKGYFERADGGTLFLDEITEMSFDLQVKLLRVLETGRFMRVGTHQEIACDVRVVAATNRSPEEAVREGKLREDLYYRLAVFPLVLPPLRQRGDDVILLANRFLDELNADGGTNNRFSDAAIERLRRHDWPGNVRELRNAVRRSYIMAEGDELDALLVPSAMREDDEEEAAGSVTLRVGETLAEADRRLILATLSCCGGVKKQTAAILGVSPKTLYNRLEAYAAAGYEVPDLHGDTSCAET
ncbi:sigma-54-dependent transcriptional regulator [Castellaniella defragrans]|uniref:sigma-54-dependent transcriptional regulator n=1 Tax=Castellaniella defragrans TaxID=75697 RepID=UPI0005BABBA1|nr:sigma-54 dependent transcriptional regulator [Castellaniella defragrans]